MKSQYIADVCEFYSKKLGVTSSHVGNGRYNVTNHREINNMLVDIKNRGITVELINELSDPIKSIIQMGSDTVTLESDDLRKLDLSIRTIRFVLQGINAAIRSTITPDDDKTLHVKIPKIDDYSGFSDFARSLNNSIAVVVHDSQIGDNIKIIGFDNGSLWINIAVGTTLSLNIIGGMVWAGYAIMNKQKEYEAIVLAMENAKIATDHAKVVQEGFAANMKMLIQTEAKAVARSNNLREDIELINKMSHSIEQISVLLKNGMEVHPSQKMAIESTKEFPKIENISLIEPKSKNIEFKEKGE